jgi:hypothetical protein
MEVELLPLDAPAVADIASVISDRDLLDAALKRPQGAFKWQRLAP